jgi:hypothetical protein
MVREVGDQTERDGGDGGEGEEVEMKIENDSEV